MNKNIIELLIEELKLKNIQPTIDNASLQENSMKDEYKIINQIMNIFSSHDNEAPWNKYKFIVKEIDRFWYDFALENKKTKKLYPFNIKSSTEKNSDNTNCKTGIAYVLTGKKPEELGISAFIHFPKLLKTIHDNINLNSTTDYYFLVYNKQNGQDIFCTSLRNINKIIPNGNNLPFQINWSENKIFNKKANPELFQYLLENWKKSIDLRVSILASWKASGLDEIIKNFKNNKNIKK